MSSSRIQAGGHAPSLLLHGRRVLLWVVAAVLTSSPVAPLGATEGEPARDLCGRILALQQAREDLRKEEAAAWPARDDRSALEVAPPPAVLRLQARVRDLTREEESLVLELERRREEALPAVIEVAGKASSAEAFCAFLPLLTWAAGDRDEVAATLLEAGRRLSPCPLPLARAVAALETPDSQALLIDLARKQKNPAILALTGASGSPANVRAIVAMAEGAGKDDATLGLEALRRLDRPVQRSRPAEGVQAVAGRTAEEVLLQTASGSRPTLELAADVQEQIREVRRVEVKTALLGYLGLLAVPSHAEYFRARLAESAEEPVRLACVTSLARLGNGGDYLLEEAKKGRSIALEQACIRGLARVAHRPALPYLVEALSNEKLAPEAVRALQAITGKKLGSEPRAWQRWARLEGEGGAGAQDPDLAALRPRKQAP